MSKHRQRFWVHSDPEPEAAVTEPAEIPLYERCIGSTWRKRKDGTRELQPAHEDPERRDTGYLCHRCYQRTRKTLVRLPDVAAWLEVNIATTNTPAGQKVTRSQDDPIPLRLDVLDLVGPVASENLAARYDVTEDQALGDDSFTQVVGAWAMLVCEEFGRPWPDTADLTSLVIYLAQNLHDVAAQPWADELMADIIDVESRAHRVAPWKSETRRERNERCERCDRLTLVVHKSDGIIRCEKGMGGCGYQRAVTEAYARVGDGSRG